MGSGFSINEFCWDDSIRNRLMEKLKEVPEEFVKATVLECQNAPYSSMLYQQGFEFNILGRRRRSHIIHDFDERFILSSL